MTIRYVTGDLLDAPEHIIVHGCNAQGVMGSGVAKTIRDTYPEAYNLYRHQYNQNGLKLGEIIIYEYDSCRMVVNMITQEFYGKDGKQYVSYEAIEAGFRNLHKWIGETFMADPGVAIPMIGSGLGGGDWDTIAAIIESVMDGIDVVVYQK